MGLAEVDGERLVGRGQRGQAGEERPQPLRHRAGHHLRRDRVGAGDVAGHRQDERARAPGGAVVAAGERLDLLERLQLLPRDAERQRVAAANLVPTRIGAAGFQRDAIVALGALVLADQVVGEPAVPGETARVDPEADRLVEVAQRLAGPLLRDQDARHAGADAAVHRVDALGALEQRRRAGGIADLQGQLARGEQRIEVARVAREAAHRIGERVGVGGRRGRGLDRVGRGGRLRGRGVRDGERARHRERGGKDLESDHGNND